jgi:hypothetical protein
MNRNYIFIPAGTANVRLTISENVTVTRPATLQYSAAAAAAVPASTAESLPAAAPGAGLLAPELAHQAQQPQNLTLVGAGQSSGNGSGNSSVLQPGQGLSPPRSRWNPDTHEIIFRSTVKVHSLQHSKERFNGSDQQHFTFYNVRLTPRELQYFLLVGGCQPTDCVHQQPRACMAGTFRLKARRPHATMRTRLSAALIYAGC